MVFKGRKEKTVGGVKREGLMKNSQGKVVSKRASAHGKKMFRNVKSWLDSVMEARRALLLSGFVCINGRSLQGKALYVKSKALAASKAAGGAAASAADPMVGAPVPVA